jgi:hypothetical protein
MTTITIPIDLDMARERITETYQKAIKSLIDVGEMLSDVQQSLPDGETFTAFIQTLPFSPRSAYHYIRLHKHYLAHGDVMVALERIKIDVWYQLKPDSDLTQKVIDRAKQGKTVSKKDLKQLTASINYATVAQAQAWNSAAEINPSFVLESFKRGVVTDLDGNDIPLEEADATLVYVNANQQLSESIHRQKNHIQENARPSRKLTLKTQAVRDNHGVVYVGLILPDLDLDSLNLDIDVEVYLPIVVINEYKQRNLA